MLAKHGAEGDQADPGAVHAVAQLEDYIDSGFAFYENRQQIAAFGNALAAGDLQGAWAAGGSVVTQMAIPMAVKALGVRHSPCQGRLIWNLSSNQASCFAAGTPIKLPDGSNISIESFDIDDAILTRHELDVDRDRDDGKQSKMESTCDCKCKICCCEFKPGEPVISCYQRALDWVLPRNR